MKLPVLVYHGWCEDHPYASDRLHRFILGATSRPRELVDRVAKRQCSPGYYSNEGKDRRGSLWLRNYRGGPFEHMDVLRGGTVSDEAIEQD